MRWEQKFESLSLRQNKHLRYAQKIGMFTNWRGVYKNIFLSPLALIPNGYILDTSEQRTATRQEQKMPSTNEVFIPTSNTWSRNDGRHQKDGFVYHESDLTTVVKGFEQDHHRVKFLNGNLVDGPVCPVYFHRVPRAGAVPIRHEMRVDGRAVK